MNKNYIFWRANFPSFVFRSTMFALPLLYQPAFSNNWTVDRLEKDSLSKQEKSDKKFLKKWIESDWITGTSIVPVKESKLVNWLKADPKFTARGSLNLNSSGSALMVFGDGMAAGWKDSGLSREGQQFAFPNLVAHQIGLKGFNSPLFSVEHGNGAGYLIK